MTRQARVVLLAAVAAVVAAAWAWHEVRPDLAPGTREQAATLEADPLWEAAPRGMREVERGRELVSSLTFPHAQHETFVWRTYESDLAPAEGLARWRTALRSAGWRVRGFGESCPTFAEKQARGWYLELEVCPPERGRPTWLVRTWAWLD